MVLASFVCGLVVLLRDSKSDLWGVFFFFPIAATIVWVSATEVWLSVGAPAYRRIERMAHAHRRRKLVLDTPTSPIAQARGGGAVEIEGRVSASEPGIFHAPFSGNPAVWARTVVKHRPLGGSSLRLSHAPSFRLAHDWVTIFDEITFEPFLVDDGSGECARVDPEKAELLLATQCVATSRTFKDPPPRIQEFLRTRGIAFDDVGFMGVRFNKTLRFEEQLLAPGDHLYALGPSRRDAGPPVATGYRTHQTSSVLVLFAADGPQGGLFLTNRTEKQLLWSLNRQIAGFCIRAILTLAGIAWLVRACLRSRDPL
jgi:hypothetical protein